jgi:hypothetical protein
LEKNQTKTNYVAQLIINQILNGEMGGSKKENAIVMDKNEKNKKKNKEKKSQSLGLRRPRVPEHL